MTKTCNQCKHFLPDYSETAGICEYPIPKWVDFWGGYGEIKECETAMAKDCEVFEPMEDEQHVEYHRFDTCNCSQSGIGIQLVAWLQAKFCPYCGNRIEKVEQ